MSPKSVFHALILAVLVTSFAGASSVATASTVRVFLLGGQSNAEGIASASGLPSELSSPQEDVDLYYYHRSSTSTLPMNQVVDLQPGASWPAYFGSEITFGRTMADYYAANDPSSSVAIIKYALGGTGLVDDPVVISAWTPTSGSCYTEFNNTVSSGLTALQAAHPGDDIEIAGMLWMQGEEELRRGDEIIAAYPAALNNFVSDMRSHYGSQMPFVIGQLSSNQTHYDVEDLQKFQSGQASVAAAYSNVGLVNTSGSNFTMNSDKIHFNAQGQMSLGYGFATEMQSLLTTASTPQPGTTVTKHTDSFEVADGYPASGSVVGTKGWTVGNYGGTSTDVSISDSSATSFGEKMLSVKTTNSGLYGSVHRSFTDTPITEGIVEFTMSVKTANDEFLDIAIGDSSLDMSNDDLFDGAAMTCGLSGTGGARSYTPDASANKRVNTDPLSNNTWYTFHALIDMDEQVFCLQILNEDGSVKYNYDGWDDTGVAHTFEGYGTYESFSFTDDVDSLENIGIRILTPTESSQVDFDNFSLVSTVISDVPEPSSAALLLTLILAGAVAARRTSIRTK